MISRRLVVKMAAGGELDIQMDRIGGSRPHGTVDPVHDFNPASVGTFDGPDALRLDILIARLDHLVAGGQIDPQLKAPHQPGFLFRHFGMQDTASGSHPLHATGTQQARIALIVAMPHSDGQHIGHGL